MTRLAEFKALSFDCYGTLIDWESGIWDALQPLLGRAAQPPERRAALKAFALAEARLEDAGPGTPYPEILERVHRQLAEEFRIGSEPQLDSNFGQSVKAWPAFQDSAEALRRLKRHFKLIILSNIDPASFETSNRKLGIEFDAIYTASAIGSYKPDRRNFEFLIEGARREFQVEKNELLHVAQSLYHDHVPAIDLTLSSAWIDRQGLAEGGDWGATKPLAKIPAVAFRFRSLKEFADAVQEG